MPEPSSSAASGAIALLAKFFPGVLGALVIAALDPPKTKRTLFLQSLTAGIGSLVFGGPLVRILDYYAPWIDLATADPITAVEQAVPVYFVIGALSWGAYGALAKLRVILAERGADAAAKKAGL